MEVGCAGLRGRLRMPQRGYTGTEVEGLGLWDTTAQRRAFFGLGLSPPYPTPRGASPRRSPQGVRTGLQAFSHTFPPLPLHCISSRGLSRVIGFLFLNLFPTVLVEFQTNLQFAVPLPALSFSFLCTLSHLDQGFLTESRGVSVYPEAFVSETFVAI